MRNHEHAFADLKKFYNEITAENLDLIKAQKEEMERIHDRRAQNAKTIHKLKEINH
jgi:chromosome segregation ATPase